MRVLVAAASRHHGTREIAEAIATGLVRRGLVADAVPVEQITTLDGYGAVVLGSAVYMGRWLGEARRFAQIHTSALCMMPVWLFSSGPVGPVDYLIPPGTPADVPVLMRLTQAIDHRTFPGRLDMRRSAFRRKGRRPHHPRARGRQSRLGCHRSLRRRDRRRTPRHPPKGVATATLSSSEARSERAGRSRQASRASGAQDRSARASRLVGERRHSRAWSAPAAAESSRRTSSSCG